MILLCSKGKYELHDLSCGGVVGTLELFLHYQIAQIGWLLKRSPLGIDLLDNIQRRLFMRMLGPVEVQAEISI